MTNSKSINQIDKILSSLKEWFLTNHNLDIDINARYIDSDLIDSLDMINLIAYIEDNYDIKFSSNDFQNPRFFTINGLCDLILAKNSDV